MPGILEENPSEKGPKKTRAKPFAALAQTGNIYLPHPSIAPWIWDWIDDDRYVLHLTITTHSGRGWKTHHFVSEYRCLLRGELSSVLTDSGFAEVRWLMPAESGFYQPIVLARLSASDC